MKDRPDSSGGGGGGVVGILNVRRGQLLHRPVVQNYGEGAFFFGDKVGLRALSSAPGPGPLSPTCTVQNTKEAFGGLIDLVDFLFLLLAQKCRGQMLNFERASKIWIKVAATKNWTPAL